MNTTVVSPWTPRDFILIIDLMNHNRLLLVFPSLLFDVSITNWTLFLSTYDVGSFCFCAQTNIYNMLCFPGMPFILLIAAVSYAPYVYNVGLCACLMKCLIYWTIIIITTCATYLHLINHHVYVNNNPPIIKAWK